MVPAAMLVAAIDMIADGVALVDVGGTILFVNRPLCDLIGYPAGELVGRSVEDLVPPSHRPAHRRYREGYAIDPTYRRMGRSDLDIEILHADGRMIPVDIQLTPMPGTSAIAATIRDMTYEREAAAARAIERLDLIAAMHRNEQMLAYYDVMLQHLFAIGTHLQVEARNPTPANPQRLAQSASMIDDLIDLTRAQVFGPESHFDNTGLLPSD